MVRKLITQILLILLFISCNENKNVGLKKKINTYINYTPTQQDVTDKNFDEIFSFTSRTILKVDEYHQIAGVNKIKIKNDKIIVSDARGKQLLIFTLNGNYENCICKNGSGPGEFNRLTDFDITKNNEIILLDAANLRVSYFGFSGNYLKSFKVYPGFRIASSRNRGFYIYNPASGGTANGDVVQEYDEEGKTIKTFCQPFFTFPAIGGNIECDNLGNVFLIHPTVYKIINYFPLKDSFFVFGNISKYYKSLKVENNSLPSVEKLNESTPLKKMLVNKYYILIELYQAKTKIKWIDIYDHNGKNIFCGIKMNANLSLGDIDDNNTIYLIKHPSLKTDSSFELEDYEILTYKIREL